MNYTYIWLPIALIAYYALVRVVRKRDAYLVLRERFSSDSAPSGDVLVCKINFPRYERPTPCIAQSTAMSLSLYSSDAQRQYTSWSSRRTRYLTFPVCVPWSALDYREASFPLSRWMRFDIRDANATFFIKKEIALQLLERAGKAPP